MILILIKNKVFRMNLIQNHWLKLKMWWSKDKEIVNYLYLKKRRVKKTKALFKSRIHKNSPVDHQPKIMFKIIKNQKYLIKALI
jgi:hypothetical protein